ncbi:hypothetical protein [Sulfitobacter sp. SK025]|uniref:hypothetical protein n=1 Tax=Sulfitobacter sp. SK025 TaxID=1389011 RepID=UPI000E0A5997|nr:hypothetical protein [Sulfitobacter sp. SK025]AXI50432.1 hypothetical protein C1J04_05695 [Sulfitobacter sp. SK025]
MTKIKAYIAIFLGYLGSAIGLLYSIFLLIELWLGRTSTPENFKALPRRADALIEWFLSQPWQIASLVLLSLVAGSTYLLIIGIRGLVSTEEITVRLPEGYMTAEQAKDILNLIIQVQGLERNTAKMLAMHGNLGERVDNYKNDLVEALGCTHSLSNDVMATIGRMYDQQQELVNAVQAMSEQIQSQKTR